MSRHQRSRATLLFLLFLAALPSCQDDDNSPVGPRPQFAQGDNGLWTVNSLLDPGNGTCDDAECTLREAIAAAAPGDNIQFATAGDIKLTTGELFQGKHLTIDGGGRIAVDAQGTSRVITVISNSGSTRLAGLTFKNGKSTTDAGGVGAVAGAITLDGVTISGNNADGSGGGLFLRGANVTVRNSSIAGNSAGTGGGGIAVKPFFPGDDPQLTLINSTVDNNGSTTKGGGIYNEGTIDVTASAIVANRASTSIGNGGGGIYNDDNATATVVRSTLSGNSGSTVLHNSGRLDLRSSTVVENPASDETLFSSSGAVTTVGNSILAGPDRGSTCQGPVASLGHNLTQFCTFVLPVVGDGTFLAVALFTQILEQNLKDNGGPTATHALVPRGRAADAGYCPGETEDQRGFTRPVDDPAMPNALDACDIGAYELQGPVAVVADLMISQAVNKTSVKQGELLTYSIRVQNLGPETAPNVVVTDLLPSGATFVEAKQNKGTHTAPPKGQTGTVTWSVGDLVDQANEVATITVTVLVKGKTSITNKASVTGDVADPNEANNSSAIRVSVAAGSSKASPRR